MSAGGETDHVDGDVAVGADGDEAATGGTVTATVAVPAGVGKLAGRVAVVTGGTRGIGRGIAEAFLDEGATVVVSGKSADKGAKALAEMGAGERAEFVACDVRHQAELEALLDGVHQRFGRLDIVVNNAGGSDGFALIHEMTDEAWNNAMDWSLNSVFWSTRRSVRYMLENGWGRIINISSVEGKQGNKAAVSHYITAKHAINGLTKATATEYGPQGITCNAICPGALETDMMKELGPIAAQSAGITYEQFLQSYADESAIKRLNTVDEVAQMALLLASDSGAGITGALLNVDGGTSQW